MRFLCAAVVFVLCTLHFDAISGQIPPRLSIPGAVLLQGGKPVQFRQQRIQNDLPPPRLRRPIPNAVPIPIRPVIEETEDSPSTPSSFDDEAAKLGISVLQTALRQAAGPEEDTGRAVHFRPERPVPVLRQDIRENVPQQRPLPVLRQQEQRENIPRPLLRQELRDDAPVRQPQPVRHVQRPQQVQASPQPLRQPTRGSHPPRQPSQFLDEESARPGQGRNRKPPVQILRKFRTDNADGSITWGYENEDGTFKEETLGIDCVTRGKYGYVDPDGVRREYTYETGNKCDEPEEEDLPPPPERPRPQGQPQFKKPQFRPAPQQAQF